MPQKMLGVYPVDHPGSGRPMLGVNPEDEFTFVRVNKGGEVVTRLCDEDRTRIDKLTAALQAAASRL